MAHKMHYPQLPDLETTGMDVAACVPVTLADDFLCTQTGRVTDIHVWGSWWCDKVPPSSIWGFILNLYSDVPADQSGVGYSMPGDLLWSGDFFGEEAVGIIYAIADEDFYDAPLDEIVGWDTKVCQYNFHVDSDEAFLQQKGAIYWLGVQEYVTFAPFGWKTSPDRWNDGGVWLHPDLGTWHELRYPEGHPLQGQRIDLAFVIVPEPATLAFLGLGAAGVLIRRRR